MHSLCALERSSAFMPAVFLLHIAILLSGFAGAAGAADKQVFMNALRSSPFMSVALVLQFFIFSCCGVIAAVAFVSAALVSAALASAALVSAAKAGAQANMATRPKLSKVFMGVSWKWFFECCLTNGFRASLRHGDCPKQRFRRSTAMGCRIFLLCSAPCDEAVSR